MRGKIGILAAMVGVGLFACSANAYLSWDFTVHPTQEPVPMTEYKGSSGLETGYGSGAGLLGDGTAEFGDAPSLSGNYGFVIGGGTGPFTVDMRVKVVENVTQTAGKSMSIVDAGGRGRGVKLLTGGMELVDGSGVVRSYGSWDFTQFQYIRQSLSNDGTVDSYLWSGSLETGSWIHLGNQGLGGSGWNLGSDVPAGVAIGSMAGSSTQSGKFIVDWVRIEVGTALHDTPPPLGTPEPTTLALLALGAMPMLRRRR